MQLNAKQLEDKNDPLIFSIFKTSFEYLLSCIANEYCSIKGFASIEEFNTKNRITKSVILAYPFFIALSNGHSESLYSLFGEFYSYTFGPASKSINYNLISSIADKKNNLDFFEIKDTSIEIKDKADTTCPTFECLKSQILLKEIDKTRYKFRDISIKTNDKDLEKYNPLYITIDNGIEIMKAQSSKYFFDGNLKRVTDLALYYNIILRNFKSNTIDIIRYSDIESPANRELYSNSYH